MRVVVASGKGGTGKTTLATALAQVAAETQTVRVLDCDVEAPNAALFLHPQWSSGAEVTRPVPRVDAERCTACGRCAEVCRFNALAVVAGAVLVFDDLCHGCGRCTWICPEQAIHEEPLTVGRIEAGRTPEGEGIELVEGRLGIGQPMGLPVLRALKHWPPTTASAFVSVSARPLPWIEIRDAPPGASCPVVETLRGADADVDAANLALLLEARATVAEPFVSGVVAVIDRDTCSDCGACEAACRYEALAEIDGHWQVDPIACEGCGACLDRCPSEALSLLAQTVGTCRRSETPYGPLQQAHLHPGQENSGKLVTAVKRRARAQAEAEGYTGILVDGPPGIGCPVIAAVSGASLALLVTEPTVSGREDLERALATVRHFRVPARICINKADLYPEGARAIEELGAALGVATIARLPFDLSLAEALAAGRPVTAHRPEAPVSRALIELWTTLQAPLGHTAGSA
jgi:MinD superfamily P-loop ATPase